MKKAAFVAGLAASLGLSACGNHNQEFEAAINKKLAGDGPACGTVQQTLERFFEMQTPDKAPELPTMAQHLADAGYVRELKGDMAWWLERTDKGKTFMTQGPNRFEFCVFYPRVDQILGVDPGSSTQISVNYTTRMESTAPGLNAEDFISNANDLREHPRQIWLYKTANGWGTEP